MAAGDGSHNSLVDSRFLRSGGGRRAGKSRSNDGRESNSSGRDLNLAIRDLRDNSFAFTSLQGRVRRGSADEDSGGGDVVTHFD